MKKKILIFSTALMIVSLLTSGCLDQSNSEKNTAATTSKEDVALNKNVQFEKVEDVALNEIVQPEKKVEDILVYDIGPRFNLIKKADLVALRSFSDLIGQEHASRIVSYKSLSVILLNGDERTDTRIEGGDGQFTAEQLKYLELVDYSTNLLIWADYIEKIESTGELVDQHWTPYLTVVPEKQATYGEGKEALIAYFQEQTRVHMTSAKDLQLKPAKLYFTVSKTGSIENVKLDRSSGYTPLDETVKALITHLPGVWEAAENTKGEKVAQEIVISFGNMGC